MNSQVPFRTEALDHRYGQHEQHVPTVRLTKGVSMAACATLLCLALLAGWMHTWEVSLPGHEPESLLAWLIHRLPDAPLP